MNQLIVSGRVSKEINVKGKIGMFTLANDRDYPFNKDQKGNKLSNFLTCKVLGEKNIERAQRWLTKGTAIIVTGHYFRDSWKEGNEYKEFNYVLVEKWEFQVGKGNGEADEQNTEQPQGQQKESNYTPPTASNEDFLNIPDDIEDELPFKN